MIKYIINPSITVEQFRDVLVRSKLGERRPVGDDECLAGMLEHADLMVTAWHGGRLIGVARSVTDFVYCCYLSDLAVDVAEQGRGIGTELITRTRGQLGTKCMLVLLSAPAAMTYYPKIGLTAHPSAWVLPPDATFPPCEQR